MGATHWATAYGLAGTASGRRRVASGHPPICAPVSPGRRREGGVGRLQGAVAAQQWVPATGGKARDPARSGGAKSCHPPAYISMNSDQAVPETFSTLGIVTDPPQEVSGGSRDNSGQTQTTLLGPNSSCPSHWAIVLRRTDECGRCHQATALTTARSAALRGPWTSPSAAAARWTDGSRRGAC